MANLEQELNNNTVENEEVQAPEQTAETTESNTQPQTLQDVLNGKEGNPTAQEVQEELWKKTKNYEQGLWKTPDDIYKAFGVQPLATIPEGKITGFGKSGKDAEKENSKKSQMRKYEKSNRKKTKKGAKGRKK